MEIRGLMIDAARQPEKLETYKKLIDFANEWNYNTVLFRVADDEGIVVKLDRVSDLICHLEPYSKKELRDFVLYANSKGIDIIPEIESFGHTNYITNSKKYAHLSDMDTGKYANFSGLCPVHPETPGLMKEIYSEIAEIFNSKYLHGGCDEVNWGGSGLSKEALKKQSRSEIWSSYINSLCEQAKKLGKEFIIWGDHILRKESGILEKLNNNIILLDWEYSSVDPQSLLDTVRPAVKKGFRIIGGPALGWCKWGPRPGKQQLYNIDAFSEAYSKEKSSEYLGIILTNWCPWRIIANSLFDGFAYASVSMNEGPSEARASAFRYFVETHYAAKWNNNWAEVFSMIYDITPSRPPCSKAWEHPFLVCPWHDEKTLTAMIEERNQIFPNFAAIESRLVLCESTVLKNIDDFKSFRLSVKYLKHIYWRNSIIMKAIENNSDLEIVINAIAEKDETLLSGIKKNHDENRLEKLPNKGNDQLYYIFGKAALFSKQLKQNYKKYRKIFSS
ncbi:MAG: hypothetical protein A2017_02595 [Lentisphaerae bacterium GWF2_44_16]|nr:MAG: hypothetical protein A2017_02595 [Lentisphaerae bacterium GWF2_44_16]